MGKIENNRTLGKLFRNIFLFVACFILSGIPNTIFALSEDLLEFYAENDIIFYDPEGSLNPYDYCNVEIISPTITAGAGYDRLKSVVEEYGEFAMDMQREFGTPWELVFAQMQMESSMGTAGHAINGAENNWLGITGTGDAGYWTSSNGRKWAVFSNLNASIRAWAGPHVLRNGYYDSAFPYLNPNNYNLDRFFRTMLMTYAPPSDGNDHGVYIPTVMSLINGPINEVRTEKGWPTSAELARNENILVGGNNPLGGTISEGGTTNPDISPSFPNCPEDGFSTIITPGGSTNPNDALRLLQEFISDTNARYGTGFPSLPSSANIGDTFATPGSEGPKREVCWGNGAMWCGQCTALSGWFVEKKTNYNTSGGGHGGAVVNRLAGVNSNLLTGSTPEAYAIFSYGGGTNQNFGHTGVVVGVLEDGSFITIENNIGSGKRLGIRHRNLNDGRNWSFAYVGNSLK